MNDSANQERKVIVASGSRALRLKRARRIGGVLGVFVVLPTLLAVIYFGFVATPQYESVAVLTVDSGGAEDGAKKVTAEERDLQVARAYIQSRALLDRLAKDHGILADFQDPAVDWWSRLSAKAGSETIFDYFTKHVEVRLESKFTLSLHVFAFSPERAHELATHVVTATGKHLDRQSERARHDAMESAEKEVETARAQLLAADETAASALEMEVARSRLASAMRGLEQAEVEASRRKRRLTVIAEASLPTQASRPRRLWSIATVLVTALALGGIFLLLGDFVREHAKF